MADGHVISTTVVEEDILLRHQQLPDLSLATGKMGCSTTDKSLWPLRSSSQTYIFSSPDGFTIL